MYLNFIPTIFDLDKMSKIQIQFAIVATLFVLSAYTMKLGSTSHKVYDNPADYLQGLQSQQSKFESQINTLETNVENSINAATAESDIAKKIAILEQGILNQENEIFLTSTSLIPVLVLKDQCTNITEADKTNLIQKCQTTVSDIKTLLTKLQTLPQDARTQEMIASANHQIYYLETIQKVLQENCTTATILSPTVYQSNIYANNWLTGNQTINDIVAQYVARSQQFDNITNCPLDRPFYDKTACINCTGDTPLFDMKELKCTNCKPGQYFDAQEKNCKPANPNATNVAAATTFVGPQPVAKPGDVLCPATAPFYNGSACVVCTGANQLFNTSSLTCVTCPAGSAYDNNTHSCTLRFNVSNPILNNETIGTVPVPGPYDVPCPDSHPFLYNGTCHDVVCNNPNPYFNLSSLQCTSCPAGTIYNITTHSCSVVTVPPNTSNPVGINSTIGTLNTTGSQCPADAPFWNNNSCIPCSSPTPYFNATSLTCVACPTGSVYSADSHSCVISYNATNAAAVPNTIGSFPTPGPNDVPCPANAPVFYNGTCHTVTCPTQSPYLDTATMQCVNCTAPNVYNATKKSCIITTPTTSATPNATNTTAANNVIGNLTSPQPNDVLCPASAPYFINGACKNCTEPTPLFNATSNSCTSCPTGSAYSSTAKSCVIVYNATNAAAVPNTIGSFPTPGSNDVPCPAATPVLYNGSCYSVTCPPQYPYLDVATFQCVNCTAPNTYNATDKTCVTPNVVPTQTPNATNPSAANSTIGTIPTPASTDVLCPATSPYYVNGSCTNCTAPNSLFNTTSQTCTTCPSGTVYNETTHDCSPAAPVTQPYMSNLASGNWVSQSPYKDLTEFQQAIQNGSSTPCPATTPYFDGSKCIPCPANSYFDLIQKKCVVCATGTTFDPTTYKCQLNTDTYQTNPTSPNLVYGDLSKKQVQDAYTAANQTGVLDCPAATPYYNGIKCIACSDPKYPWFNIEMKDCVNCTGDYAVTANNQCVNTAQGALAPNLSAMAANAFGHHELSLADVKRFRHRFVNK